MTSKQRAFLRSLAVDIDTIIMVGKGNMNENIIKQADDALAARELNSAEITPREVAEEIAKATNSDVVQVIGSKFVLYRRNDKEPKIVLPKASKKK